MINVLDSTPEGVWDLVQRIYGAVEAENKKKHPKILNQCQFPLRQTPSAFPSPGISETISLFALGNKTSSLVLYSDFPVDFWNHLHKVEK